MTASATPTTLEHELGPHGRFTLKLPAGTASIQAVDGTLARVRDLSGRPISERFQVTTEPGLLELAVRNKINVSLQIGGLALGGAPSAELVVELPRGTAVAVDGASTDVSVIGIAGPGRYRTASGDLILQDVAGDVDVEAVSGDLRIEASAAIELKARTISGDARIRAPRLQRFEMSTTSGDIRLDAELTGPGPFSIRSISGDVSLVARGALQVEAQTVTGDLTSELPHQSDSGPGRRRLTLGRGGATLSFRSVSGDLVVVEPRQAAAVSAGSSGAAADVKRDGAARNLDPTDTGDPAASGEPPLDAEVDAARLEVLRALERGEIDVETATERLTAVEG